MAEKREGFRFSERTTNNLSALIEMGLARNKTEAVDIALEHIVTEERTKRAMLNELRMKGVMGSAEVGRLTESADFYQTNPNNRLAATISAGDYTNGY